MIGNVKIGDKVKAKDGGPAMTVSAIEEDVYGERVAQCRWKGEDGKPAEGIFPVSTLVKA